MRHYVDLCIAEVLITCQVDIYIDIMQSEMKEIGRGGGDRTRDPRALSVGAELVSHGSLRERRC